jgi:hypothetical protein
MASLLLRGFAEKNKCEGIFETPSLWTPQRLEQSDVYIQAMVIVIDALDKRVED